MRPSASASMSPRRAAARGGTGPHRWPIRGPAARHRHGSAPVTRSPKPRTIQVCGPWVVERSGLARGTTDGAPKAPRLRSTALAKRPQRPVVDHHPLAVALRETAISSPWQPGPAPLPVAPRTRRWVRGWRFRSRRVRGLMAVLRHHHRRRPQRGRVLRRRGRVLRRPHDRPRRRGLVLRHDRGRHDRPRRHRRIAGRLHELPAARARDAGELLRVDGDAGR